MDSPYKKITKERLAQAILNSVTNSHEFKKPYTHTILTKMKKRDVIKVFEEYTGIRMITKDGQ